MKVVENSTWCTCLNTHAKELDMSRTPGPIADSRSPDDIDDPSISANSPSLERKDTVKTIGPLKLRAKSDNLPQ